MIASLPAAAYTAVMAGKNGGTGVGLVEIYDTDPGADSELANVSTRGFVQTGDNVMIGGFILGGASGNYQDRRARDRTVAGQLPGSRPPWPIPPWSCATTMARC